MAGSSNSLAHLLEALSFSADKHRDQRRKDHRASPYINHPIEVATVVATVGDVTDLTTLVAAILHDTLEDTETTREELDERFGREARQIVEELTDDNSLPKPERKRLQVIGAPRLSDRAKLIRMADKICNIRDVILAPPTHWTLDRKLAYLDWTYWVVDGCRGVNAALEARFEEVLAQARRTIG